MEQLQQTTPIHRVISKTSYCKTVVGSTSIYTIYSIALLLANSWHSVAKDWTKRHDFAKTYVGISNYFVPNSSQGYYVDQNEMA